MKKHLSFIVVLLLVLIGLNFISSEVFKRYDLTQDKRFTISEPTRELLSKTELPIVVDVFLEGELPAEFRKLKQETRQLLEELSAIHPNLKYNFIDPIEGLNEDEQAEVMAQLGKNGVKPAMATIKDKGRNTNVIVYPYAIILYDEALTAVPLLKSVARATTEQRVNSSIQQLEYQLADGIRKVSQPKTKKIAVLEDSGELNRVQIADLLSSIQEYYPAAPYGIEFVNENDSISGVDVLNDLKRYDLIIEAKPTIAYSETKKYVLDQYLMQGGKMIMAIDPIVMESDSLSNNEGRAYPLPRDLGIDEMLFRYGLRLNSGLIKDLNFGPIALATGQGRNTQYEAFPWPYFPITKGNYNPDQENTITKNLEDVKFEYAGSIDTLKNSSKKTILLSSSPQTQILTLPAAISLSEIDQEPNPAQYQSGSQPLAVLTEGSFTSAYKNRVKPFNYKNDLEQSKNSALLLIADGDVLKNQVDRGQPQDLGYDRKTGMFYGNKEFMMNSINYMLDDSGIIDLRNKNISIPFLNTTKTYEERTKWQLINVLLPLVLLATFGICFVYLRKKKYS
ncbi:MAG: gliding motility-associated ABC transporter substrate-binding protein GldG [Nonlabens sp.]